MDNPEELYTIGQISRMCNIPVQTLRYYDGIGLLVPERVDPQNNYRYFSKKQVLYLFIIKHFKTYGFSLEEIRNILRRENLTVLQEKLEEKLQQTIKSIQELEYLQEKLEIDINNLKRGKEFSEFLDTDGNVLGNNLIEMKIIPEMPVLFTRYRCSSTPGSFIKRFSELTALMEKYKLCRVGPLMAAFYDYYTEFDYNNADIEVCIPIAGDISKCPNIRNYGGFMGVTMLHRGQYSKMSESYGLALKWIEKKGFEYVVPAVEKYIIDAASTGIEKNYVTEIILPIR